MKVEVGAGLSNVSVANTVGSTVCVSIASVTVDTVVVMITVGLIGGMIGVAIGRDET
jgi:hypothetical protein